MNCERAVPLVPLYLDGELSDIQADELRPHLLECPTCRSVAQAGRALKAWFVPTAAVPVPAGFAARVARRALAGDAGSEPLVEVPRPVAVAERRSILTFAQAAVAAAAAVLLVFAIVIRRLDLPDEGLRADDVTLEDSLEALDRMNAEEAAVRPEEGAEIEDVDER
jgi:anti-sigma factor RsiW